MIDRTKNIPDQEPESEHHGTEPLPTGADNGDVFSQTMVLDSGTVEEAAAKPAEQLQPGSVLRDRYLLKEQIGSGSMGVVFKALDRHLTDAKGAEAAVAIKVLAPHLATSANALRALQQEAAKGRFLSHPGIARFIDLDRDDQLYFIVMEWLDGQSLADILDAGLLADDLARALDIVSQVADALEYAHKRGVIHADIKPGNIVLLADGTAKLVDFGIARARQSGGPDMQLPATVNAATPAYSSMQVLTGEEPLVNDDVFSLACLAYRLIAGHRVFGPRNAAEAAAAGMEPQRPPALSDSQWQALRKGLSYSRVSRQQTPRELVNELMIPVEPVVVEEPLVIPADAVLERRFDERRSRWPLALLVILLAAIAAFIVRPPWVAAGLERLGAFIEDVQRRASGESAVAEAGIDSHSEAVVEAEPATPVPASTAEPPAEVLPAPAADVADAASALAANADIEIVEEAAASDSPVAPAPAEPPLSAGAQGGPAQLVLAGAGRPMSRLALSLSEDGDAVTIELERVDGLAEALLVRVDEVGFSGSRSPGRTGEYGLSGGGVVRFDPGQRSAELIISPVTNTVREPDRQISLLLRDYYDVESVLAQLDLRLLDDDQREFEADLPVNTVAFAVDRSVVRERDPAAQIDLHRFNPDNNTLSVRYDVRDVSATEGEDYFVPTQRSVTFGPGQRAARLLISLVQDTVHESNERFTVELDPAVTHSSTISSVAVIIVDDDDFGE